MTAHDPAALLVVGHGSTVNPDSSTPTIAHTAEVRRRNIFSEVACAFWKEEPSLRDALFLFSNPDIREVYVVPNFISKGYFTETVIPRELELTGPITIRGDGKVWKYCDPVGDHQLMTDLLLQRARAVECDAPETETTLLIVAHGTDLNDKSGLAAKREARKITKLHRFGAVMNVYMEEPPLVSDWAKLTNTPNVIVVPFFISDGLHSYEDIPRLLGIELNSTATTPGHSIFQNTVHHLEGRCLYYGNAIGTDPRIVDIILEQVADFDQRNTTRTRS